MRVLWGPGVLSAPLEPQWGTRVVAWAKQEACWQNLIICDPWDASADEPGARHTYNSNMWRSVLGALSVLARGLSKQSFRRGHACREFLSGSGIRKECGKEGERELITARDNWGPVSCRGGLSPIHPLVSECCSMTMKFLRLLGSCRHGKAQQWPW